MRWWWWSQVAAGRSMIDGVEVMVRGVKELVAGKTLAKLGSQAVYTRTLLWGLLVRNYVSRSPCPKVAI